MSYQIGDKSLKVSGTCLECEWIGPPPDEAATIVLLHEGLGCVALWRDFPERLAAATGCGVFVYSRAGYGGSDPVSLPRPLTYMHDEAQDVLPALLDAISFRRGLLLGHSDGASIAAIYAGSIQDHRVRGLVLMAPHFFVEDISAAAIKTARNDYTTGDLRQRLAKYHDDNVDCAFLGWNDAWGDSAFRDWDITESVAHIRVPILILQGNADAYGSIEQVAVAEDEAYCPVDGVIMDGCGHAPHLEQPEETLRVVTTFVDRLLVQHGEGASLGPSV